jgi:hypothetical protein
MFYRNQYQIFVKNLVPLALYVMIFFLILFSYKYSFVSSWLYTFRCFASEFDFAWIVSFHFYQSFPRRHSLKDLGSSSLFSLMVSSDILYEK